MVDEIKKKNGRPTLFTLETIAKLEEAFLNGATDKEAIFLAQVSSAAFYNYEKNNPEFVERKEGLKDMVKYKARMNITGAINMGDKTLSQWYLERKAKDEFAQRTEQTGKDGTPLITEQTPESIAKAKAFDKWFKEQN